MKKSVYELTLSAMLCAIGMVIPIVSPFKILLEPASFTLFSHVAIFIAMFISPKVGVFVGVGTAVGFLFQFPLVVVLRAFSHVLFAFIGALILKKHPDIMKKMSKLILFSLFISLIHALSEVIVVIPYYFSGSLGGLNYEKGFFISVIFLVGIGTLIHSMFDFFVAWFIHHVIKRKVKEV